MPVWLAKLEPSAMIRSASFMNQLAIGVPDRPSTPPALADAYRESGPCP